MPDPAHRRPTWDELSEQRRGPDRHRDEPGIDVPPDWRSSVAGLPHDRWMAWRRRSERIQAALGRPPTADEIEAADRRAAAEILASRSDTNDTD